VSILDDVSSSVAGAIEDVMDKYEDRYFIRDSKKIGDVHYYDFMIDGEKFTVVIQRHREDNDD
jgi:hypothetical protein